MADTRVYIANAALKLSRNNNEAVAASAPSPALAETAVEGKYVAISPNGTHVQIPKELFVALVDFIKTRKYPGSINIQFRSGEIICVEAVAKKTYR